MSLYSIFKFCQRLVGVLNTVLVKTEIQKIGKGSRYLPGGFINGGKYIQIGRNTLVDKNVSITAQYVKGITTDENVIVSIGDNCRIGQYSHITGIYGIKIGYGVWTGPSVLITDNSHGAFEYEQLKIRPDLRPLVSKGKIVIEDNVWIGEKATILPGVHIGEGSVIGANAVVSHDVPPFSLVAGVPAKVVRQVGNS